LLAAFVRGLQGPAATTLQIYPPRELEDAIQVAERVEQAHGLSSKQDTVFPIYLSPEVEKFSEVREVKQVTRPLNQQVNSPDRKQQSNCFACGGRGHFAAQCATRQGNRQPYVKQIDKQPDQEVNGRHNNKERNRVKFCFVCGDPNHLSWGCPKRVMGPVNKERRQGGRTSSPEKKFGSDKKVSPNGNGL
jgi:hypothetical protein